MPFPTDSPFSAKPEAPEGEIRIENLRPAADDQGTRRRREAIEHIITLFFEDLDDQTKLQEIWDTVEEFA